MLEETAAPEWPHYVHYYVDLRTETVDRLWKQWEAWPQMTKDRFCGDWNATDDDGLAREAFACVAAEGSVGDPAAWAFVDLVARKCS